MKSSLNCLAILILVINIYSVGELNEQDIVTRSNGGAGLANIENSFGFVYNPSLYSMNKKFIVGITYNKILNSIIDGAYHTNIIFSHQFINGMNYGLRVGLVNIENYKEIETTLNYSYRVIETLIAGININMIKVTYDNVNTTNDPVLIDGYKKTLINTTLGIYYEINKKVSIGSIIGDLSYNKDGTGTLYSPIKYSYGIKYNVKEDLTIFSDITFTKYSSNYSLGIEYSFTPILFKSYRMNFDIHAGINLDYLSIGLALKYRGLTFEYLQIKYYDSHLNSNNHETLISYSF